MSPGRCLTLALLALPICAQGCFPKGWPPREVPLYLEQDFPFTVGPYVILVEQGTVAVVIEHDLKEPPEVIWKQVGAGGTATSSVATTSVKAERNGALWTATMTDLPLDVPLAYSVRSEVGNTDWIEFRAGRTRGQKFSFGAFGDTRTGHRVHRALVGAMAREAMEFVVHSGDLVETGGVKSQWELFFQIEAPLMSGRPMIAAVGNHDNSQRQHYRRYFLCDRISKNNRFFAQDWGDVRVVILDSEIEMRKGSEQYAFAEYMLAEGAAKGMIMVLSMHYPPYSSGAHGSSLEIRETVGELAPRYGVEVVLAGHDHDYERTKRIDGVTYIVAASGGAPIRRLTPSWFSASVRTQPHFVVFDVDRESLVGRAVNLEGEIFDSFVIPPNPPRPELAAQR